MADLLRDGMAWLAGQLDASVGQTATCRRGEQSATLTVTYGSSLLRVSDGHGGTKTVRTERDLLFTATSLDFGGGPTLPQRGDVWDVTEADGSTTRLEVMPPGPKESEWRRSDPWGKRLRVHTKFLATLGDEAAGNG